MWEKVEKKTRKTLVIKIFRKIFFCFWIQPFVWDVYDWSVVCKQNQMNARVHSAKLSSGVILLIHSIPSDSIRWIIHNISIFACENLSQCSFKYSWIWNIISIRLCTWVIYSKWLGIICGKIHWKEILNNSKHKTKWKTCFNTIEYYNRMALG